MLQNQATMPSTNIIWLLLAPQKTHRGLIIRQDTAFGANNGIGIVSHHVTILHSVTSRKSIPNTALVSTVK